MELLRHRVYCQFFEVFILSLAVHERPVAPHPHPLNVIVLLVPAILWGGLPHCSFALAPLLSFPSPSSHPFGTHHTQLQSHVLTWTECPWRLTGCKIPEAQLLPHPFFSQVVFPHHWPHGHLHLHRSHSGLCWPLLCLGESPFFPPLEGSKA